MGIRGESSFSDIFLQTVAGLVGEAGDLVQGTVGQDQSPEDDHVQTRHQNMAADNALDPVVRVRAVRSKNVQLGAMDPYANDEGQISLKVRLASSSCDRNVNELLLLVNGGWSSWGSYGSCSVTCGGGNQYKSRSCSSPSPRYGGSQCSGSGRKSRQCSTNPCPIDGGWADWGSYSACSVTCGGGTQSRSRTCTNPTPQHNGKECSGKDTVSQPCNTQECPNCNNTKEINCTHATGAANTTCIVDNAESVTHVTPLVSGACQLDTGYGFHSDSIWVTDGCDGEFTVCYIPVPPPPPPPPPSECRDTPDGVDYRGTVSVTVSGRTCQEWSSQSPHIHSQSDSSLEKNYCRNPDGEPRPWCYTTDLLKRWEYCSIPFCEPSDAGTVEECLKDPKGENYIGYKSVTKSGLTCQHWESSRPHSHSFTSSMAKDVNYCRNPDGEPSPWCYTTDPATRWEFCSIPECAKCNVDEEKGPNNTIIHKVSGQCHYSSHTRNSCKYTAKLLAVEGKTEVTLTLNTEDKTLLEGDTLEDCAKFKVRNGVLMITEDDCNNKMSAEQIAIE
ncbi:hypothetical protein FSP39_003791 [Pinctada imbricata]|uniref:Kringle domain-containing protein n=1 Tax=Pinctada imbricata TaxID=66713 RepID=A0AA88XVA4_PINIB|nr:hypothetical protein FSP39_003791 [Pinctada imbricata]